MTGHKYITNRNNQKWSVSFTNVVLLTTRTIFESQLWAAPMCMYVFCSFISSPFSFSLSVCFMMPRIWNVWFEIQTYRFMCVKNNWVSFFSMLCLFDKTPPLLQSTRSTQPGRSEQHLIYVLRLCLCWQWKSSPQKFGRKLPLKSDETLHCNCTCACILQGNTHLCKASPQIINYCRLKGRSAFDKT